MNKYFYTLDNKRYTTFNYYLKTKYHCKVAKIIINANFTCPNRDGTKGTGGCYFCSNNGSGDSNIFEKNDILSQYYENKKIMDRKWKNELYIPFFQSFSNTYGPINKIKKMIEPFLSLDEVAEISIATRCDCLNEEIINYLNEVSNIKPIWLEIGLQTSNDKTRNELNVCYTFEEFCNTLSLLSNTKIKKCIHIINGLPGETRDDMIKTISDINGFDFEAIKIHMLHIVNNTFLASRYNKNTFPLLSCDEYVNIVVEQLRLLKPEIIIERLTGDPLKDDLIEPKWVLNKTIVLNEIDKLMSKLNCYQGDKYNK